MIKKVVRIENLGCLRKLVPERGDELGEVVGLYAENGSGKTTLVAALRAAHECKADALHERQSLPLSDAPFVHLRTTTGDVKHSGGEWQGNLPSVEIFDRAFIAANVYDGQSVGPDQRSQLYRIALGAGEVEAAVAVDEAKKATSDAKKPRDEIAKRLNARCSDIGMTLVEVKKLEPLSEPPADLPASEARLRALRARRDLEGLPQITPLPPVKAIDVRGFRSLLDRTATSLSEEAMAAVKQHIATCLDTNGEAWILHGTSYAEGKSACPYCGQALESSRLATLFPKFFDSSYQELRDYVGRVIQRLSLWDTWLSELRAKERANQKAFAAWAAITDLDTPPEITELPEQASAVVSLLRGLMEDKQARLLEPLGDDPRLVEFADAHSALQEPVLAYNNWANQSSAACRKILADHEGEVRRLDTLLRRTRGRLLRGTPSFEKVLRDLEVADKFLEELTSKKKEAEDTLTRKEAKRTETFLGLVNQVLTNFGAGFRIRDLKGKQSSSRIVADFKIALVEGGVDLAGATVLASSQRRTGPRFDTVLSEGDRTTLALAVFFARCLDAPDPERIAVLDDPLTSLDRSRRKWTAEYVRRLRESCAQVWLLSHDEYFLKDVGSGALPG